MVKQSKKASKRHRDGGRKREREREREIERQRQIETALNL